MKIIEILADKNSKSSLDCLQSVSKAMALPLSFQTLYSNQIGDSFLDWLSVQRKEEGIDLIRINPSLAENHIGHFSQRPNLVNLLECFDHLHFQNDRWWPCLVHFEAIRLAMMHRFRAIDTLSPGYVVGDSALSMICAAVLGGMGFQKIYWLGDDLKILRRRSAVLRGHLLGIDLKHHPLATVTTLSEKGSAMLCTLDLTQSRDLLADLLYFNYIKKNGLVADFFEGRTKNIFLDEARKAELVPLSALDLNLELDWQLLMRIGSTAKTSYEEFRKLWWSHQKSLV